MAPLDSIVRRLLLGDEIDKAQDRNGSITADSQYGERRSWRSFACVTLSDKAQVLLHHWGGRLQMLRWAACSCDREKLPLAGRVYLRPERDCSKFAVRSVVWG